jgi:hypothetical protein
MKYGYFIIKHLFTFYKTMLSSKNFISNCQDENYLVNNEIVFRNIKAFMKLLFK